jgi:hypothetical protein
MFAYIVGSIATVAMDSSGQELRKREKINSLQVCVCVRACLCVSCARAPAYLCGGMRVSSNLKSFLFCASQTLCNTKNIKKKFTEGTFS